MKRSQVIPFRSSYKEIVNYSYLIIDRVSLDAALVDCSWECEKIINYIDSNDICLKMILLTHSHFDHVVSVEQIIKKYNTKVYMSQLEINYYQYQCDNLIGFEDFQSIKMNEIDIRLFVTPGHTRGSACFEIENMFFSGDTVFYEGCGTCAGDGADAGMMYESFQKIKKWIPESHRLYSGHSFGKMPGSSMKKVYKNNLYFNVRDKDSFVKFRMRGNQPSTTIFH